MVKHAPMGDPVEVRIHGYELTLRRDDARKIEVADVREADAERLGGAQPRRSFAERVRQHPGLGEGGKFHDRDAKSSPLPEGDAASRSRSWATRTAARPRCSTSSPARTSTWATSRA